MKITKGSWQTTAAGWAAVVAVVADALRWQLDADPATNPDWGVVVAVILAAFGVTRARQNNKSSEDVGAKK